jgi:hypothetical protein
MSDDIRSRVFVSERDRAIRTMLMLNARGGKTWLLGISSDEVPMFDIEERDLAAARQLAQYLKRRYPFATVAVFDSGRGFHVVARVTLHRDEFEKLYRDVMRYCKVNGIPLDYTHAELSIKYKRTTLRISKKWFDSNSKVPELVYVYE